MRHLIACEVFRHELEYLTAGMLHPPQLHFLPQGLHDTPDQLTVEVQNVVNGLEDAGVKEISLCYGLCGRGISGVRSRRADLLIPAVHDCIALLTGSFLPNQTRDQGVYWMSAGWLEYSQLPFLREKEKRRQDYTERFDADSAAYLMEMEDQWLKAYSSARLILWEGVGDAVLLRSQAHHVASQANLPCEEQKGSPALLRFILEGSPEEKGPVRLLRVKPGTHLDIDGNGQPAVWRN